MTRDIVPRRSLGRRRYWKDTEADSRAGVFRRARWDCVDAAAAAAAKSLGYAVADTVSIAGFWLEDVACSRTGEESLEY